jgi:hypothetical protein
MPFWQKNYFYIFKETNEKSIKMYPRYTECIEDELDDTDDDDGDDFVSKSEFEPRNLNSSSFGLGNLGSWEKHTRVSMR